MRFRSGYVTWPLVRIGIGIEGVEALDPSDDGQDGTGHKFEAAGNVARSETRGILVAVQ